MPSLSGAAVKATLTIVKAGLRLLHDQQARRPAVAIDLIWKILVIGFLWDISAKLGRSRSTNK
jgi:hypothetical protein